jgi:hypothetical protein
LLALLEYVLKIKKEIVKMKYKVGDKVKVRSWEDMEKEYGVDSGGFILAGTVYFSSDMRKFCGKRVTIRIVIPEESAYFVKGDMEDYWFTDAMLEGNSANTLFDKELNYSVRPELGLTVCYFKDKYSLYDILNDFCKSKHLDAYNSISYDFIDNSIDNVSGFSKCRGDDKFDETTGKLFAKDNLRYKVNKLKYQLLARIIKYIADKHEKELMSINTIKNNLCKSLYKYNTRNKE